MSAVLRNSTIYTNIYTNHYLQKATDHQGRVVPVPFELTVQSAFTTGDTYNLCVVPAYAKVVGLFCSTDGLSASAGVGTTFQLGDSGDDNRYMAATDFDALDAQGALAMAGAGYVPTADAIVVGKIAGTAVVGKKVTGCLLIVPGA